MRSSSSARRRVAGLLACLLAWEWGGALAAKGASLAPVESALLLRYAGPGVGEAEARVWAERLPAFLSGALDVRWAAPPCGHEKSAAVADSYPAADGQALARISAAVEEARRLAARMETREAGRRLSDAEGEARRFRLGDATRPLLADVFLWKGTLLLWDGRREEAEAMFARSRALRPDFSPDPALFSPLVREAWSRASERPRPGAEVLVSTVPAGAEIRVDGTLRGRTPARIRLPGDGPVTVRVERPGYRPVERSVQWLPGDAAALDVVLPPDPAAAIGELLAASPDGGTAGASVGELAAACGAGRAAVVVLERAPGGELRARVLDWRRAAPALAQAGEVAWDGRPEGVDEAARGVSRLLSASGWPAAAGAPAGSARPWYHNVWLWGLVGAVAVGVAIGLGGGGGGASGSSTGTIGVTF